MAATSEDFTSLMKNMSAMMSQFSEMKEELAEMRMESRFEQSLYKRRNVGSMEGQQVGTQSDLSRARFEAADTPNPTTVFIGEMRQNHTHRNHSTALRPTLKRPPTQVVDSPLRKNSWLGDMYPPATRERTKSANSTRSIFGEEPRQNQGYLDSRNSTSAPHQRLLQEDFKPVDTVNPVRASPVRPTRVVPSNGNMDPQQIIQVEEERRNEENQEVVEPVVTVLMGQALISEEPPSRKQEDFVGHEGSAKESHEGNAKCVDPAKKHDVAEVSNQLACNDEKKNQQPSAHLRSIEEPQLSEVSEKGQDTIKNESLLDATESKTQTKVKKEGRKSERPFISKGSWKAHQQPKYERVFNDVRTSSHDKCPFCDKTAHRDIRECKKVALYPTSARWQLTRLNRLCFKCLIKHDFGKCKAPPCQKCQGFHNVLLHFGRKKTDNPNAREKKKGGRDHDQRRQRQPHGGEVNVEERKMQKCRQRVKKTSRKEVERDPIMSNARMPSEQIEPIEPNQAESKGHVNERRKKMKRRPILKEQVTPTHSKSKTEKPSVNVGCPEPEYESQPCPSEKSSKENNLVVTERATKKEGSLDDFGQVFPGLNCKALRYLIEEIVAKVKYETPNRLGNQLSSKGTVG